MTLYTCPVCAYPEMADPVEEGNICPCCGTEFGYDNDLGVTYRQLRDRWITDGMQWFSPVRLPSDSWDPVRQLVDADYDFDIGLLEEREIPVTPFSAELLAVA